MQNSYYQTFDGGSFNFDNLITSQNALNPGATGNGFASFLLGYGSGGSEIAFTNPWESMHYQGYLFQDTWQASSKLTVTAGIRWEIPGTWHERYNRIATFNGTEINPITQAAGITLNGQPVLGAVDFVNTPEHPSSGYKEEHFHLFAPRLGIAYRLNDKTVIRTGGGFYYLPSTVNFADAPWANPVGSVSTNWVATTNNEVTPANPISNPYPSGFIPAPGNLPHSQAEAMLFGQGMVNMTFYKEPYPFQMQWNFTLQRQLPGGVALEAAYAGARGEHLPSGWFNGGLSPGPGPVAGRGSEQRRDQSLRQPGDHRIPVAANRSAGSVAAPLAVVHGRYAVGGRSRRQHLPCPADEG